MTNNVNIDDLLEIARLAGKEVLEVYKQDFEVYDKEDNSPLTEADQRSNKVIIEELSKLYPDIPCISEETKLTKYNERKDWPLFWLIDPLDGTKEFVKKNGEFTINIALIRKDTPIVGVVYVPVTDKMYYAEEGKGAFLQDTDSEPQRLSSTGHYSEKDKVLVVASRSHLSDEVLQFVEDLKAEGKEVEFLSSGSSLKFCLVAEGKADVYPRFGPTMEWDTGAAHAVVLEAGRQVFKADSKEPLLYNKENLLNPWFIVE